MGSQIIVKGYQVGTKVRQEGMRTIYEGLQIRTGRKVWITVIAVRPGRSFTLLEKRAGQSKKFLLPHLITALDFGEVPNHGFYYVHDGISTVGLVDYLESIRDREERMYETIKMMIRALEVVDYIHLAGTTHRDLTTNQMKVGATGEMLLDGFVNARPKIEARNVANLVHLPYIAPEQLKGAPADKKTDIYSMGIVLYELLTGRLPFESNYSKLESIRQGTSPSPSKYVNGLPAGLENVVMKAIAPRSSRYRSVGEMLHELDDIYQKRPLGMKFLKLRKFTERLMVKLGLKKRKAS